MVHTQNFMKTVFDFDGCIESISILLSPEWWKDGKKFKSICE